MFHLIKKNKGLFTKELFKGEIKDSKRNGFGIQLFPNGCYYIGYWKDDRAHGFGRLCFKDGTYYEGVYYKNMIQNGKMKYFNGACFEGAFDQTPYDRFSNGTFSFKNGYKFRGEWKGGYPVSGEIYDNTTLLIQFEKSDSLLLGAGSDKGIIISKRNKWMYEGGINDKNQCHGKGYIYCTFQQYKFGDFEDDQLTGKCYKMSINWGEISQGICQKDKKIGTWQKLSNSGYLIHQTEGQKQVKVSFPYLNDDFYIGTISNEEDSNHKYGIVFRQGIYQLGKEDLNENKIELSNVGSIFAIPQVAERGLNFQFVFDKIFSDTKMKSDLVNLINKIYSNFQIDFENKLKFFKQFLFKEEDNDLNKNYFKQNSIPSEMKNFQQLVINKYFKKHKSKSQVKTPRKVSKLDSTKLQQSQTINEQQDYKLLSSESLTNTQVSDKQEIIQSVKKKIQQSEKRVSTTTYNKKTVPTFNQTRSHTPNQLPPRSPSPFTKTNITVKKNFKKKKDHNKTISTNQDAQLMKTPQTKSRRGSRSQKNFHQDFYGKSFKDIEVNKAPHIKFFQGSIINNKKQGLCQMIFSSGLIIEGLFLNDQIQHGLISIGNQTYKGRFTKGVLQGQGQFMLNDKLFKGQYINGEFFNNKIITKKQNLHYIFDDNINENNMSGKLTIVFLNNFQLIDCEMKNGELLQSKCKLIDPFGVVSYGKTFKNFFN